jgi:hypothetical protein
VSPAGNDYSDRGEARLGGYLEELRAEPPAGDRALVRRIARSARWQQAVRAPLQVAGVLAAAVAVGVAGILGFRRGARG